MGWKNLPSRHFSHRCQTFTISSSIIFCSFWISVSDFTRLHGVLTLLYFYMSLIWFVVLLEEFMSVFSSLHNVWEHFMVTRSLPAILNMSNINLNFAFSSTSSRSLVRYCALLRA